MISLRLAWREIRNSRKFSAFFALNLALGLAGFVILDTFKAAFDQGLETRSKLLLSADLAISARRPLTPEERGIARRILGPSAKEGKLVEMYSMASTPRASRLIELDAIDSTYPFYGELTLKNQGPVAGATPKKITEAPEIWICPDLALQLGTKIGDHLKLGEGEFRVSDFIVNDSGDVWRGFSLASRAYIGLRSLRATGLIRKGSVAYYSRLYELPAGADVDAVARKLDEAITDPAVQVKTHRQASEEVARLLNYLDDYLGLVALVALFLSAIGAAYLFRSFLAQRLREIAILAGLGMGQRQIREIHLMQLALLGSAASIGAIAFAGALLPLISYLIRELMPFPVTLGMPARTLALACLLGIAGSVLICYPLLLRLRGLRPSELFQESEEPSLAFRPRQALAFAPGLAAYWSLSIWQAHSIRMGSLFIGLVLVSGAALIAMGSACLWIIRRTERERGFVGRLALRNIARSRLSSISCFVAIGIGALLLNLVPEIQHNLDSELTRPNGSLKPGLFLFDIQEEQVDALRAYLGSRRTELMNLSPLIRARLTAINGKAFEKETGAGRLGTREEEREQRFRNRGLNLSYRERLASSESIAAGEPFGGRYTSGIPEVSVERRYADRLGIKLHDLLDFDVQGIPVHARVTSLRRVRWTSFQPNFFILFQPGVLEDAPKTYLAGVPQLDPRAKIAIQNGIVERFPNISMINVSDLVEKLLEIFHQMSLATQVMALLSIFAGMVVLFSIANHQASTRSRETNLMKVLGTRFSTVRSIVQIEFGLLGFGAGALGAGISYLVSYVISTVVFDGVWAFSWATQLGSIAAIAALSTVTSTIATRRVLRRRPIELLQSSI